MSGPHALYILAAYAVSAAAFGGLALWLVLDMGAQRRELRRLEEGGLRRRSDRPLDTEKTA